MADNEDGWNSPAPSREREHSASPLPSTTTSSNNNVSKTVEERNAESDERAPNLGHNLHIGSLTREVKESDLELLFSKIGKVLKVSVMRDPHSREPRGFGFVTMEDPDDAERAIEELNATTLEGRSIVVSKARRSRARTPTPGTYVGPPKRESRRDGRSPPPGPPPHRRGGPGGPGYDRGYDRYDDRRFDRYDRGYGRDYYDRPPPRYRDYDYGRPPPRYRDDYRRDDFRRGDRRDRDFDRRGPPRRYDDRPPRRNHHNNRQNGPPGDGQNQNDPQDSW